MKQMVWKCLVAVSMIAVLIAGGWGSYTAIQYLRTSPRFEVKQVSLSGLKRLEENQVLAEARLQIGTNIFSLDMDDMRHRIEHLGWVRHALVHRILPDQILIKVFEREPVGVGRINGEVFQFDIDAVVLEPDPRSDLRLPVLDGLRANNREGNLRKVQLYLRVIEDLKGQTELSEIRINDADEVSVVSVSEPQLVDLGAVEVKSRWFRYLEAKPQIKERYPDVVRVDLRFRDQIIVKMSSEDIEEKVIWGAGKSSL
jgi:cell division protein FtsQ